MQDFISYTSSPYLIPVLTIIILLLLVIILHLYSKIHTLTRGENGKSFESTIRNYLESVDDLKKHDEIISKYMMTLESRLKTCIRNVATVRFKAFDQNASNQSFAVALVNEEGDGVVLSSLHHRDRISMFAKPINAYTSTHDLTEEEKSVLEESKSSHHTKVKSKATS